MVDWNFTPERPISLTLVADARLCPTSYSNDQIWNLNTGSSEPLALSLQTTYGLRARTCRIFPRFIHNNQVIIDPSDFYRPITIRKYYPNYLSLSFKPFSFINADIEFWVPSSQVIACRTRITNTSHETCQFQLEWAELLIPSLDGNRMAHHERDLSTILAGQTSNLFPVFFLTGGVQAGSGPYPSLNLSFDIPSHGQQESHWVNASLEDLDGSFELAKATINRNWDAEFAHIQRINSQQMEITTGNQDWNTAIYLAQTIAPQLILQPPDSSKSASFVYSRQPDQGYSMRKDGSDYSHLWNGQTTSDTYYLSNFLLPSSPGVLKGLLDNFLATQVPSGEIDWKPGLAGQLSQLPATPLLATLAWEYYYYTHNIEYLKCIFPQLTKFYFSWFTDAHDRDHDMFPEWDQAIQTGFEEHPLFSFSLPSSTGLDISTVESPDLAAYLYRDGESLISIGRLLKEDDTCEELALVREQLKKRLDESWNDQLACYQYQDRDSHHSAAGTIIGTHTGSGTMEIHQEFLPPVRPILLVKSKRERTQPVQVYIHGNSTAGTHRVDHIPPLRFRWHLGEGYLTSEYIYQSIEQISISGVLDDVEVIACSADLTGLDQTLLLPLWAGVPDEDRAMVLSNLTILEKKKFLGVYGLRSISRPSGEAENPADYDSVNLPWNSLVLEGFLRYGMYKKAADIFSRLMKAILISLKSEAKFHQAYHSESGKPSGPVNTLSSLLPVGLFLKILGVTIIDQYTVEITHGNPFPWPVTIKYCGLTIAQQEKKTVLIFPGGQVITVENDHPQTINVKRVNVKAAPSPASVIIH